MIQAAILVIFPLCMAVAAFSDLFTMTIPNRVSMILLASFLIVAPLAGLGLVDIGWHLLAGLCVFAVVFVLFAFNTMGGGDAKVLTASAVWFGFNDSLVVYMGDVAVFGCALTIRFVHGAAVPGWGAGSPGWHSGEIRSPRGASVPTVPGHDRA